MKFDKYKIFPFPVLRPYSDDYLESEFQANAELQVENNRIIASVSYSLSCDEIRNVISKKKACYATSISCRDTFVEHIIKTYNTKNKGIFPVGEFRGEVRIDSMILATREIKNFACAEINAEFGAGPFIFRPGQVLAQDESNTIYIDKEMFKPVSSVFDLVKKNGLSDDEWVAGFDEDHVQIGVSPKTKKCIDEARNSSNNKIILLNSIYFAAVTESINRLKEDADGCTGKKWGRVILRKASNMGIDIRSDDSDSYCIAQKLMDFPMGRLNKFFGENS